jgi:hypothetical protein
MLMQRAKVSSLYWSYLCMNSNTKGGVIAKAIWDFVPSDVAFTQRLPL